MPTMRNRLHAAAVLTTVMALVGCAPRQDPGVPLPPPGSGVNGQSSVDGAVAPRTGGMNTQEPSKFTADNAVPGR